MYAITHVTINIASSRANVVRIVPTPTPSCGIEAGSVSWLDESVTIDSEARQPRAIVVEGCRQLIAISISARTAKREYASSSRRSVLGPHPGSPALRLS